MMDPSPTVRLPESFESKLAAGGRFVVFRRVWSFLLFTRDRVTGPVWVAPGDTPAAEAWKSSLFTFLFGWWALPFGPLRTIRALLWNAKGGRDVTEAIIRESFDEPIARRMLALRPTVAPPSGKGIWSLRFALLIPPLALGFLVWDYELKRNEENARFAAIPGGTAFLETRRRIFFSGGGKDELSKKLSGHLVNHVRYAIPAKGIHVPTKPMKGPAAAADISGQRVVLFFRWLGYGRLSPSEQDTVARTLRECVGLALKETAGHLPADIPVYLALCDSGQWIFLERMRIGEAKPVEQKQRPVEGDLIRLFEPGFIAPLTDSGISR